ncbi:hypothetical protein Tco_1242164, partial [Tanacetum coccineum]
DTKMKEGSNKAKIDTTQESSSKRACDELEQEKAKKQKGDDDQEEEEMKKHIEIVKDDEVAVDAIPLATKPLGIDREDLEILWKLVKAKHENTRLEDDYERVLWGDLKPAEVTTDSGWSPKPELFVVHPGSVATRIKDRKYKTRGGLSRPLVKRKLEFGSLNSRATRAKTSTSKDDVPFLIVSDDDEGLSYVPELKDATACHLKISAITPPAWKNH